MLDRHVCVPGLFIHRMQLLLHIVSSLGTQQVLLNEGSAKVPKPYLPLLVKDTFASLLLKLQFGCTGMDLHSAPGGFPNNIFMKLSGFV